MDRNLHPQVELEISGFTLFLFLFNFGTPESKKFKGIKGMELKDCIKYIFYINYIWPLDNDYIKYM